MVLSSVLFDLTEPNRLAAAKMVRFGLRQLSVVPAHLGCLYCLINAGDISLEMRGAIHSSIFSKILC